jgi:transcriptional regulator with XRE-family HTH domain
MQRFGEKLSSLRKQQGMTVRELAGALGYARACLQSLSNAEFYIGKTAS